MTHNARLELPSRGADDGLTTRPPTMPWAAIPPCLRPPPPPFKNLLAMGTEDKKENKQQFPGFRSNKPGSPISRQGRVVGISKLARLVDIYAKRLQIQEKMTAQIANTINDVLKPEGVGVIIKATHHCMTTRGAHKPGTDLVTSRMLGVFRDNALTRQELLGLANSDD